MFDRLLQTCPPSKVASANFKRQEILSRLMAVVPIAQKSWRLAKFQNVWKMLCDTTAAELHCHDLGPDHRPPHTAHADGPAVHHTAGTQSAI